VTDQNNEAQAPDMAPASDGNIRVFLTSTSDTGFADFVSLPAGATIKDLWRQHMGTQDPSKYVIRVERHTGLLPEDFLLQDGDKVTVTPHKVAGAEKPGFSS
jgi:hypothetical protein